MISKTSWNRIIYVATGLVIIVVIIIAFYIIPQFKADISPTATPEKAVPAFWVIVLIQLLIFAALIYSIMFSHKEGHFENGLLVTAGVILILLGLILIDAASASLSMPELHSTPIFLFICIGFDFISGILSFVARYFRGHILLEK
jgi:Na+/proline symporter